MMPSVDLLSHLIPADTASRLDAAGLFERLDATDADTRHRTGRSSTYSPLPEPNHKYINNHIHTAYSFSLHTNCRRTGNSPFGLCTAGIVDHDVCRCR